eukprot:2545758-Rhodomonas_salina.1
MLIIYSQTPSLFHSPHQENEDDVMRVANRGNSVGISHVWMEGGRYSHPKILPRSGPSGLFLLCCATTVLDKDLTVLEPWRQFCLCARAGMLEGAKHSTTSEKTGSSSKTHAIFARILKPNILF